MIDGELSVPFLTRKMLAFEYGTVFGIRIQSQSRLARTITIRGATKEGAFVFAYDTDGNGAIQTQDFNMADLPVWVSITDDASEFGIGDCFAQLSLIVNGDALDILGSGYIYNPHGLTWPAVTTNDLVPLRGKFTDVSVSNIVAGTESTTTVPANEIWKIDSIYVPLVTDANAATRTVSILVSYAGTPIHKWTSPITQIASLTRNYLFQPVGAGFGAGVLPDIYVPIPQDVWIPAGSVIATVTTNIQATDDYGTMNIRREQFMQ